MYEYHPRKATLAECRLIEDTQGVNENRPSVDSFSISDPGTDEHGDLYTGSNRESFGIMRSLPDELQLQSEALVSISTSNPHIC